MNIENNKNLECKNNVVRIVKSNILFLHQKNSAQRQFDYFTGLMKISNEVINNFNDNVKGNYEFCNRKNIQYLHIVFPGKISILKEELKRVDVNVNQLYCEQHTKTHVLYPLPKEKPYLSVEKYGTHNTSYGYWNIICDVLTQIKIPINFNPIFESHDVYSGGLSKKLGREMPASPQLFFKGIEGYEPILFEFDNSDALKGNTGKLIFKLNFNAPIKKRIVLFGDSFFVGASNILSHIFEEVIFLRSPFIIKDIASSLQADIILTGNAERYLVNTPSALHSAPYFIKYFNKRFDSQKLSDEYIDAIEHLFLGKENKKYLNWKQNILISRAKELKNKGDLVTAIQIIEHANNLYSNDEIHLELSRLRYRMKQYDLSEKAINDAISLKPQRYMYHEFYGDILKKKKQFNRSERAYRRAISLNNELPNVYYKLSKLFFIKKGDEALEMILHAIELSPPKSSYFELLGDIYLSRNELFQAKKAYESAINVKISKQITNKLASISDLKIKA